MTTSNKTPTAEEFLNKQLELLMAGDTAGLAQRYAPDALFVRFDKSFRGRSEIKRLFDEYLLEKPEVQSVENVVLSDDVLMYQATELLNGKPVTAVGTIIFVNGLVWRQSAAFI